MAITERLLDSLDRKSSVTQRIDAYLTLSKHKAHKSHGGEKHPKSEKSAARSLMLKLIMPALSGPDGTALSEALSKGSEQGCKTAWERIQKSITDNLTKAVAEAAKVAKDAKDPKDAKDSKNSESTKEAAPATKSDDKLAPAVAPRPTPGKGNVA